MSDTVKLYVTGMAAKFIPGLGTRQPGEAFDLPEDDAIQYVGVDGFSLTDPNAPKPTPKKATKPKTDKEA
jgi:hypothetical protein